LRDAALAGRFGHQLVEDRRLVCSDEFQQLVVEAAALAISVTLENGSPVISLFFLI
jgi:hypothetical protein